MHALLIDIRYALKGLLRAPAFAAVAIGSLALGIGTNTAVFSVFNAVLVRPLPYPDSDHLAAVFETNPKKGITRYSVCPPDFLEWREGVRAFQTAAAYRRWEPNLTGVEEPQRLAGLRVSGTFFETLGTAPALGRILTAADESERAQAVVISHGLWQRVSGGDPQLVGRTLRLDGTGYVVAGVMPADFQFPSSQIEIWAPLNLDRERNDRGEHSLQVIARLRPDATAEQARTELQAMMVPHEATNDGDSANLASLRDWHLSAGSRSTLWILLGAVGLLLLTACANLANLLLARGGAREREFMVRSAIGATRGRLIAQLVTEYLVIAVIAGLAGLLLATWSREGLMALLPEQSVYRLYPAEIDWRVMLYCFATSVGAGALCGIIPAFRNSGAAFLTSRSGTRATPFRLRATLLVAQTALAVTLVAGAGLLGRTFLHVWNTERGFDSADVVTARVNLPGSHTEERRGAFFDRVLTALHSDPSVSAAGLVTHLPLIGDGNTGYITIEGREALSANNATRPGADRLIVSPGYFRALGVNARDGRLFGDSDAAGALPTVVINESMARRYWPNESAVGRRIKRGTPAAPFPWLTIVGVIPDMKQTNLLAAPAPTIYLPFAQNVEAAMTVVAKGRTGADALAAKVRTAVRAADSDQPIAWIRSLDDVVMGALGSRWLPVLWMTVFASLALLLAAAGVYGVVSFAVERRRREFGIRMALGADRADLIRLSVRQALVPALIGGAIGLSGAALLARVNSAMLVGVTPVDAPTFLGAVAVIALVALVASYPPARRISNEDAAIALRSE